MVEGDEGGDYIKSGSGKDLINGGPGDDTLRSGSSNQTNDRVRDVLDCGPGVDTVYLVRGQDAVRNCEIENPPEA